MTDFKLAGIVSAVGLGLGYLLGRPSSKVMEAVQEDYAITYMESHNDAKNQHKYYLLLTSGQNNYTAYGRLPGYGREATMKLDKQSSLSKMKELAMKKMKTYQLVGHKYDQIPSEIRTKLENEIGVNPSSPPAESKPQKEEPKKPVNARLAMAMKRRQMMKADQALLLDEEDDGELMAAEYQPDQELRDYSVSEIAKSSAIEGYQPNKYSFGPISLGAESVSSLKLKKESCCCGATKKTPCVCMVLGSDCSAKKPMCACYRLKAIQEKDKKAAEYVEEFFSKSNGKTNLTLKEMGLLRGIENDYKGNQWGDSEGRMSASLYHDEWDMRVYRGVMSSLAKKGIIEIGEPEKIGKIMANWVSVNPKYTVEKGDDLEVNWNLFDYKEMNERFPNVSLEQTLKLIDGVPHVFNPSQEAKKAESNDSDSIPIINPKHKTDAFKWIKKEGKHIKSDADKEMDEYDYTAMTFLPEELESGAVNALNAGDLEAAQTFVKALNRQKFIKAYQAEKNR